MVLPAGSLVEVYQTLGGSITVVTPRGLARIDGADADALGMEGVFAGDTEPGAGGEFSMDAVFDAMRTVYDPEIPINIVDLGLVYRCDEVIHPDGRRVIDIDMSMTAPGCGMGDILKADVERVVGQLPGISAVDVNLVFDPPWSFARLSEEARLELGLM